MLMRSLLLLALVAGAAPAAAQDWYAVEVIVFQHRADASTRSEHWPPDPGQPALDDATGVQPPTRPLTLRPYEQLRSDALAMGGARRTLENSARYEVLVHTGWLQPGLTPDAATPVRIDIDSGRILPAEPYSITVPEAVEQPRFEVATAGTGPLATNPWLAAERLRTEFPAAPVPERLAGTVTLLLQRFLHLEVDLLLTTDRPLPADDEPDWQRQREDILADLTFEFISHDEARARLQALDARPRYEAYRLREQRRVRTDELHYFDHPKFGVVATVRPASDEQLERRQPAAPLVDEVPALDPPD